MSHSEFRDVHVPKITWAYDQYGIITEGSHWDQDEMTVTVKKATFKGPYYQIKLYTDGNYITEFYSVRVFFEGDQADYHIHKYSKVDWQHGLGDILHSIYDPVPEIPEWFEFLTI